MKKTKIHKDKKCPCGLRCYPRPEGEMMVYVCLNHGIVYREKK